MKKKVHSIRARSGWRKKGNKKWWGGLSQPTPLTVDERREGMVLIHKCEITCKAGRGNLLGKFHRSYKNRPRGRKYLFAKHK